ncbi:uncharacterized protein LOC126284622 [Schistocerca gregaria]|uniref:uncharacterized protein LOC126284622 n=1 Tax=Schistocerca gregaria TaxID=7010 RepID=UPI00211E6230|nr:uncharacterized protein LOC126284622 [Schistocerca gregaria]
MNAVFTMVMLSVVAAVSAAAEPTTANPCSPQQNEPPKATANIGVYGVNFGSRTVIPRTSPSQHQKKGKPVAIGNIGVYGVNFGANSFRPTVNVNNTSYPLRGTYHSGYVIPRTSHSQPQKKGKPVAIGNIGVNGVNFGANSFRPTVNVNNTSYPLRGTYHSGYVSPRTSSSQPQKKGKPVAIGHIGVYGVNFGANSFRPTVNVNNTSYPRSGIYHSGYVPSTEYPSVKKPIFT